MTLRPLDCGSCTLCCEGEGRVILHADENPGDYGAVRSLDPETEKPVWMLPRRPGGDCAFLVRGRGCSIYERRPKVCRAFDCRLFAGSDREKGAPQADRVRARGLEKLKEDENAR